MATDFRFNGQQSYSPLLSALAEAPANRAKLDILQQQNQRERLSSLLTNMANAAATARQIQLNHQQQVEQTARENSAKSMNPQNGNLLLGNPAFGAAYGGMAGTGAGIDTMFGGGQSSQQTVQPNLAGEGVTPNNQNIMGANVQDLIQKAKLKAAGFTPSQSTDSNTDLSTENYLGTGIPSKVINPPPEGELPPLQKRGLMEQVAKFRSDPDYKDYANEIQAARNLKVAVNSQNPIAQLNVLGGQIKNAGISRVNPTTLSLAGHDPSVWEGLKQKFETAQSGKFTDVNKDELNSLADMMMSSAQAGMNNLASSYSGDFKTANPKSVNPKMVDAMFGQAVAPHMKGAIKTKPFKKTPSSAKKGVDLGNGFSYTIK